VPIIHKVIHKDIHHDMHCDVHRRFGAGSNEQDRPGRASALSDTPRSETSLHRRARNEEDTGGLVFPAHLRTTGHCSVRAFVVSAQSWLRSSE
jgi:hypothetical protein